MRKKGCFYTLFFAILFIGFFCVYHIRTTNNFFMGSNTVYYKDIFGYSDSEWICKYPEIEFKVYDLTTNFQSGFEDIEPLIFALMTTKIEGKEQKFVVTGYRGHIEIHNYENNYKDGDFVDLSEKFYGFADYKKNFWTGEVTSFTIYDIRKDEIFNNQYKKLKFKRKE